MKSVQRREQCWLKENLVWEKPPTVKSTPTTRPPKGKHLRAAAPQHSKQYCCLNVQTSILMFGKSLMSSFCPETSMKKSNNNIILLILDGLDELPSSKLSIFLKINWRKSTPQMPHSCNSKTQSWKRGEKMLWHAASDRRIHSKACERICHQVL